MASERIHAPDLTGAVDWLNVPRPLSLKDLRGKVVLLDFWTYGCVNCMHVIPELRRLEEKYRNELVVIGVHSAKFTNERASENLRRILVRYDIDHPVANDAEFRIWREYGARAWPTMVLIDPEGYVVATASGEGKGEAFDQAIGGVVAFFDEQGKIDRRPIALSPERERLLTSTLAFPGKVAADAAANRLVIADSNHHRVLVTTLDGKILDTIGDGRVGLVDGDFAEARFYRPQGVALEGDMLYVADTENHVVRAADLSARQVTTIAGTGRQAQWGASGGAARESSLNSPWDVLVAGRLVFIAMAGAHQIWMLDRERPLVMVYAGSGREARLDGGIDDAAFAQPSGLARHDDTLFVADSEASIIRAIGLPPSNQVRTLAGGDLFEFGDIDGAGDAARLQHPLGVAWAAGRVFIADTYNHKIKTLDPVSGRVTTFAGDGFPGADDGKGKRARFYEPGGICAAGDALFVADTNNHLVRRIEIATAEVSTIRIATG